MMQTSKSEESTMTSEEFIAKVKKEVGFTIFPATFPAFGQQVYAGYSNIFDLDGNYLRQATEADIKRWNDVWKKTIEEARNESKNT
jgi:hypothetical protein